MQMKTGLFCSPIEQHQADECLECGWGCQKVVVDGPLQVTSLCSLLAVLDPTWQAGQQPLSPEYVVSCFLCMWTMLVHTPFRKSCVSEWA
jgi:hypothetical protein